MLSLCQMLVQRFFCVLLTIYLLPNQLSHFFYFRISWTPVDKEIILPQLIRRIKANLALKHPGIGIMNCNEFFKNSFTCLSLYCQLKKTDPFLLARLKIRVYALAINGLMWSWLTEKCRKDYLKLCRV